MADAPAIFPPFDPADWVLKDTDGNPMHIPAPHEVPNLTSMVLKDVGDQWEAMRQLYDISTDSLTTENFNRTLPARRITVANMFAVDPAWFPPAHPEKFDAAVKGMFILYATMSAPDDCDLKQEVDKFIKALAKLKARIPQRRRDTKAETKKASDWKRQGKSLTWTANEIDPKYSLLDLEERAKRRKNLRDAIRLYRLREEQKKAAPVERTPTRAGRGTRTKGRI